MNDIHRVLELRRTHIVWPFLPVQISVWRPTECTWKERDYWIVNYTRDDNGAWQLPDTTVLRMGFSRKDLFLRISIFKNSSIFFPTLWNFPEFPPYSFSHTLWKFRFFCLTPVLICQPYKIPLSSILTTPGISEFWDWTPPWKFHYPHGGIQNLSGKAKYHHLTLMYRETKEQMNWSNRGSNDDQE